MNIHHLIADGEHQQQDFKYRVDDAKKIARTLVAFANTDGGRLLVGVKDNGKIVGIRSDEELYVVESAAEMYSQPPLPFETRLWELDGKQVLEVWISRSTDRPHRAPNEKGEYRAYVRRDDENLMANRVLVKVWQYGERPKGGKLEYTETEQLLFAHLREHETITFSKFRRIADISRAKAETILVRLIAWKLLDIELTGDGAIYALNKDA